MNSRRQPPRRFGTLRAARGFSLIEVLVALVILGVGLLGFALLQTMNLRFAQSANQRTQATNLAYDLLDQMRANRYQSAYYTGSSGAGFVPGSIDADDCGGSGAPASQPIGEVTIAGNVLRWQCQVLQTLGPSAGANVNFLSDGQISVSVYWADERWSPDNWDTGNANVQGSFEVVSRL
ncbi:type IV pilus modification protein PilV [Luteimonas abyssi]|uniref:type IV pilus modification protein PilV n=1 Tax=Luteimonas abyssi TaxID=1247514 RepID=UPI000737B20D|nr:type IV pilus modification protein PilV [Luteimonas abyssi]